MREYVTLVTSPTDWIDVVVKALKLVFGDSVPPVILHTVGCLALGGLALIGLWGVLWIVSKIKSLWSEQFWPMFYNAEAVRHRELRRRFADHIESEMRRINNLEQWSDHRFAELEAEVQAEGRGRWRSIFSFFCCGESTQWAPARKLPHGRVEE